MSSTQRLTPKPKLEPFNAGSSLAESPEPEPTVRATIEGDVGGIADLIRWEELAIHSAASETSRAHLSSSVRSWDPLVSLIDDPDIVENTGTTDAGGIKGLWSSEKEEEVGPTEEEILASKSDDDDDDDDMSITAPKITSWMEGSLLGSGTFGPVYEGITDDGLFFAVKEVYSPDHGSAQQFFTQLEQEIQLLSKFQHENIVQYLGTSKKEARLFIFLELVTQDSLASLYQKNRLRDSQVSAYTTQILKGLSYLHEHKVVHGNIKCANVLIAANGSVKLADFGLAKAISKFYMLKLHERSFYWMAPEVVNPRKTTYGPPADIWSLGCTVLEMLTRRIPYHNLDWKYDIFIIGRGERPPIPSSLSKDARDFINQCVQVNPEARPSASQLLEHPFVRRPLPTSGSGSDSSPSNDRWNT